MKRAAPIKPSEDFGPDSDYYPLDDLEAAPDQQQAIGEIAAGLPLATATYRGKKGQATYWLLDLASGDAPRLEPVELRTEGAGSVRLAADFGMGLVTLKAAEGKAPELAALLRKAAELDWPADEGREVLRQRAQIIELRGEIQPSPQASKSRDLDWTHTGSVYYGLLRAVALRRFPDRDEAVPRSADFGEKGTHAHVEIRDHHPGQDYLQTEQDQAEHAALMWSIVDTLGDRVSDVLDYTTQRFIEVADSPQDRIEINVHEALTALGYKLKKGGSGRRGGFEREQRLGFIADLLKIDRLWLEGEVVVREGRQEKRVAIGSRVFMWSRYTGQRALPGHPPDVHQVTITPGDDWGSYLLGPGKKLMGWQSRRALSYGARYVYEKRLLRYFARMARINAHKAHPDAKRFKVATLLEEIALEIDVRRPLSSRSRLEDALDRLHANGDLAHWQYAELPELPSRGWLTAWRALLVEVEWPEVLKDAYRALREAPNRPTLAALPSTASSPEAMKAKRSRSGISQQQAAEQVGISQPTFSRAERGHSVGTNARAQIRRWLGDSVSD